MDEWIWRNVFAVDRHDAFDLHVALLGNVLRDTVIDLVLFALLRVTRRHSGEMGMSGQSRSLSEELVLAPTIFWSWLCGWLPARFPARGLWLAAPLRTVVRDGVIDRRAELMTEDEPMARLRLQRADVRRARVECNRRVSLRRRGR